MQLELDEVSSQLIVSQGPKRNTCFEGIGIECKPKVMKINAHRVSIHKYSISIKRRM